MPSSPVLALLALVPSPAPQDEAPAWPHWRGPERDGVSRETDWSSEGADEPLWRAEVGPGYSNVSIVEGRLFTLGYDVERAEDRLVCLDAGTGAEHWAFGWPEELKDQYHGGGTNSTPTVHAGVVFVAGRSGQAFALDAATGAVRWQHDFQAELDLPQATYGFSASPVVVEDALYLTFGATALCVAAADGRLRWRTALGEREGYATPVPFVKDGEALLTNFSRDAFLVQRAATGEIVQRFPFTGDQGSVHAGTPIVVGDDVFLSSAYGAGAARIRLGAAEEPQVVWRTMAMRNKVSGCTLKDGFLYGFDESMLKCLDFETGQERWRERGLGLGAVAVAGERLLVISSRGELIVAPASPEGFTELSRRKVLDGGVYWTTPVLLDGRVFVRSSLGSLVCLDHRPRAVTGAAPAAGPDVAEVPTVEALLAAHGERSGAAALAARTSVRLVGTYQSAAEGIPPTAGSLERTRDGRWRLEWDLGEFGSARRVCDGQLAWQEDPFYGTFLFEGDALREALETEGLQGLLGGLERGAERRVAGRERLGDRDCWRVELTSAGGAQRSLYFDVATGRLAGRTAPSEAMVVYDDWRAFEDVWLPARTTWLMPGTGAEEVFWTESVRWDAVDEAHFARPSWVARELRSPEQKAADGERLEQAQAHLLGDYREPDGPLRSFAVHEGALALLGRGAPDFVREPDDQGRFFLEALPAAYLLFELDDAGRGAVLRIEGIPGEDPIVCPRAGD